MRQPQRLRGDLPTAALAHLPGIALGQKFQPQGRRRCIDRMLAIAQRERAAIAAVGRYLQAAQCARIAGLGPAQHRRARAAAQALFERPQGLARLGLHHFQMFQHHPACQAGA